MAKCAKVAVSPGWKMMCVPLSHPYGTVSKGLLKAREKIKLFTGLYMRPSTSRSITNRSRLPILLRVNYGRYDHDFLASTSVA